MTLPEKKGDSYVLTYNDYEDEQGHLPARCEYICDVYDIYIYIYIYSISISISILIYSCCYNKSKYIV